MEDFRIPRPVKWLGATAAAVIAILVFSPWTTIDATEVGVHKRYGEVIGTFEPGFHVLLPIDEVLHLDTTTRNITFADVLAYSKDQQIGTIRISATYRIDPAEAEDIARRFGSVEALETRIIQPRLFDTLKTVFGRYTAKDATSDRGRLNVEVTESFRTAIGSDYLLLESIQIENIDFPESYEQAIDAQMQQQIAVLELQNKLEQDRVSAERVKVTADGEAAATVARATADATKTKLEGDAAAYAIQVRGEAEAAALRAKAEALAQNPLLIELITSENWNGTLPTTMLPGSAVPMVSLPETN